VVARVAGDELLPLAEPTTMKSLAAGAESLRDLTDGAGPGQPIEIPTFAPAIPDPGAIYTIGHNYGEPDESRDARPQRPLVYGKVPTSVAAHGDVLAWDRSVTPNVDAEVELGVVMGVDSGVFGYTIIDDVSSRDPWLDGDQWLLGKSMAGFCPVGPWIVTADDLDPTDLLLRCTINGVAIQEGSTAQMRFSIPELIAYLSRHVTLRPGDLIATGTPARLAGPLGPERHLEPGDVVTAWIEGIGELTTTVG
jgi:2-keto-4-pentenoate hydratase/2-oxohepta-3-ene-1,7-dioic acid hydratase in catechol pathway